MGGLNSGRFGRRSDSLLDSDCIRVRLSELRRAGLLSPAIDACVRASPRLPIEVELNGDDASEFRVRLSIGTNTGPMSWVIQREGPHVPAAKWLSETSLFVRLATTRPTYGGLRYWFVCPRSGCRRRCEVLYRPKGCNARAFACRECYHVKYVSQRLGAGYRAERHAERFMRRLAVGPSGAFQRPPGMHVRTYARLLAEVERFVDAAWELQPLGRYVMRLSQGSLGFEQNLSKSE